MEGGKAEDNRKEQGICKVPLRVRMGPVPVKPWSYADDLPGHLREASQALFGISLVPAKPITRSNAGSSAY